MELQLPDGGYIVANKVIRTSMCELKLRFIANSKQTQTHQVL